MQTDYLCDICFAKVRYFKSDSALCDACFSKKNERKIKIHWIMTEILGIPMDTQYSILSEDLYDIFMNDEKFDELITKVRNKAFW